MKQWAFMGTEYMENNGSGYHETQLNVTRIEEYIKVGLLYRGARVEIRSDSHWSTKNVCEKTVLECRFPECRLFEMIFD